MHTSLRILMTLSDLVVLVMEVMSRTTHSDMVTVVRLRCRRWRRYCCRRAALATFIQTPAGGAQQF